nr:hypothetical protein CFP56_16959 [Quercus suber]
MDERKTVRSLHGFPVPIDMDKCEKRPHQVKVDLLQVTITTGSYNGRVAYVVEPKRAIPLSLLDLPPEIRVIILKMVLMQRAPFFITEYHQARSGTRAVQSSFTNELEHRYMTRDDSTDRWENMPPSTFAVLRVSKTLLHEAAPIAYGNNTFCFTGSGGLAHFISSIAGMRVHLKHVCLAPLTIIKGRLLTQLGYLHDVKDLRSLVFRPYLARTAMHILVEVYASLLRPVHKAALARGQKSKVLDVICIRGEPCDSAGGFDVREPQVKRAETRQAMAFEREIRTKVARELHMDCGVPNAIVIMDD